jgi:5-methylcytosine-specific restriction enzyme A
MKICRKAGCNALTNEPYCEKHKRIPEERQREAWRKLDEKKTDDAKRFYRSLRWTQASILHRGREPLCRRCRREGIITVATITHHNPDREILISRGIDLCDDRYLESICMEHHQEELRKKRGSGSN